MENITTLPSFRRSQKGRKSGDGAPKRNGDKMESEEGKMAHMRMKIPQVAFMPQMAMDVSQLN